VKRKTVAKDSRQGLPVGGDVASFMAPDEVINPLRDRSTKLNSLADEGGSKKGGKLDHDRG